MGSSPSKRFSLEQAGGSTPFSAREGLRPVSPASPVPVFGEGRCAPMIDPLRRSGLLAEADIERFCRRGHVAYESGDHGDLWLALGLLFADPRRLRAAAGRLAERLRRYEPEVVCGPLVGGALVGQWV